VQQITNHSHALSATSNPGTDVSPAGKILSATSGGIKLYYEGAVDGNMNAQAVDPLGGSQPHENMQPYLCINYIISLFGVFPSQT